MISPGSLGVINMEPTRVIQVAVARADLIICDALRYLVIIAVLAVIMLLTVIAARPWTFEPIHWIDYDAPGVDITSEGPEDGDPWYKMGGE